MGRKTQTNKHYCKLLSLFRFFCILSGLGVFVCPITGSCPDGILSGSVQCIRRLFRASCDISSTSYRYMDGNPNNLTPHTLFETSPICNWAPPDIISMFSRPGSGASFTPDFIEMFPNPVRRVKSEFYAISKPSPADPLPISRWVTGQFSTSYTVAKVTKRVFQILPTCSSNHKIVYSPLKRALSQKSLITGLFTN